MFSRILTAEERQQIQLWMKANGAKHTHIRTIAVRAKKFTPQIRKDLALIERFVAAYNQEKHRKNA